VLAGHDELGAGKPQGLGGAGMVSGDARGGGGVSGLLGAQQVLGLLAELLQARRALGQGGFAYLLR